MKLDSRLRGNDGNWIPASAGMTTVSPALVYWQGHTWTSDDNLDSRLRGNDGRE